MRAGTRIDVIVLLFSAAGASAACNTLLGLGEYGVETDAEPSIPVDGSSVRTPADAAADAPLDTFVPASNEASCTLDSSARCYSCPPTVQAQFLNACTSAACVPFDDTQRLANLLPDGALPPLPPIATANDAGIQ